MNFYHRKLYALLQSPEVPRWEQNLLEELECLRQHQNELGQWWGSHSIGNQAREIAASSDRVNLHPRQHNPIQGVEVRHPISGQKQQIATWDTSNTIPDIDWIKGETDAKKVFWWFWRFYPEVLSTQHPDILLYPAHNIIPDCPLHSYQSTVSALAGAMFPSGWKSSKPQTPYLLIFTFSPVQEFIKSSRKFLDFWAGSYLLHYLSVQLCWHIAQYLGPDAVIVPSLWSQEIIDALILEKYPEFAADFACFEDRKTPVSRFSDKTSTSLSTAGFPNVITALVPGEAAAQRWGRYLAKKLTKEWRKIGEKVRNDIRERVIKYLNNLEAESTESSESRLRSRIEELLKEAFPESFKRDPDAPDLAPYRHELEILTRESCWEWNKLWDEQLNHTWEPYWAAVPLGSPDLPLIKSKENKTFDQEWIKVQQEIAQAPTDLPSEAEDKVYDTLNVGTWWGSLQQRLRTCLQAVKTTRNWQIPTAPGERSTISGQFSAVHPRFNYTKFCEGAGTPAGSMRLFWLIMSKAYPGLFNGSERLNALELTKRMAWVYGGVAKQLGVKIEKLIEESSLSEEDAKEFETDIEVREIDYEQLIRFPNLSSIAAARFAYERPDLLENYWQNLHELLKDYWGKQVIPKNNLASYRQQKRAFYSKTRRPFDVSNTDKEIKRILPHLKKGYNGVMFSSKWLADDMGLEGDDVGELKNLIDQAHRHTGFGDSSPADWWVIILADGDGMGSYVSGEKLKKYRFYFNKNALDQEKNLLDKRNPDSKELRSQFARLLFRTPKRMGPATHVGLNRALLDFSNRLVPYLTEKRFCGRVIYSGGDDVKVVLPLEDLPEYILSLRAAWCGGEDPHQEFTNSRNGTCGNEATGYWHPTDKVEGLPKRPHFTMGAGATMSMGVVIAHKSVPLPTVLESLWEAEAERAKKMPGKDGICFRVIYAGGNQLEALMKGELLEIWWDWVKEYESYQENLSPLLYRLAEELPHRACITENYHLFSKAAKVIMDSRDPSKQLGEVFGKIENWLDEWEDWTKQALEKNPEAIGTTPEDLSKLLRFTAFWVDKRVERHK